MAWTIGAGSSGSTPFAPAVGANAISVMRAGLIVGLFGFVGALIQGANVSEAIGRELVGGVILSPIVATVALLTAACLVSVSVFTGIQHKHVTAETRMRRFNDVQRGRRRHRGSNTFPPERRIDIPPPQRGVGWSQRRRGARTLSIAGM